LPVGEVRNSIDSQVPLEEEINIPDELLNSHISTPKSKSKLI
jgi:hypothetical protein